MQRLADLSDPIVDIDFGASQTERGLATHRDEGLTLATMLTVIRDRAHLVGIAAVEHLVYETVIVAGVIVAGIVTRVDVFEAIPVIDKDLFEDVGVLRRCCHHQIAPSKGIGLLGTIPSPKRRGGRAAEQRVDYGFPNPKFYTRSHRPCRTLSPFSRVYASVSMPP